MEARLTMAPPLAVKTTSIPFRVSESTDKIGLVMAAIWDFI